MVTNTEQQEGCSSSCSGLIDLNDSKEIVESPTGSALVRARGGTPFTDILPARPIVVVATQLLPVLPQDKRMSGRPGVTFSCCHSNVADLISEGVLCSRGRLSESSASILLPRHFRSRHQVCRRAVHPYFYILSCISRSVSNYQEVYACEAQT